MGQVDSTVQVFNLSPQATLADLNTFFSYCGTVDHIQLQKNKDETQSALVIFREPYAYQTALLLNDAIFAGQHIRVVPSQDIVVIPIDKTETDEGVKFIPAVQTTIQAVASKSIGIMNKTKNELEESYKLSEKGKMLADQTRSAIAAAQQAAVSIGASGAAWLSGALDRASKRVAALGNGKKYNPNSRKQK